MNIILNRRIRHGQGFKQYAITAERGQSHKLRNFKNSSQRASEVLHRCLSDSSPLVNNSCVISLHQKVRMIQQNSSFVCTWAISPSHSSVPHSFPFSLQWCSLAIPFLKNCFFPSKEAHNESEKIHQFSSVQSLSRVWLFEIPWTAARQASLSTNSWSLLKLMSIELVMPSNHLTLCRPLLLPSSIFSNVSVLHIRWPKY